MDAQTNQQTNYGSLGFFFPQPQKLKPPTKQDLVGIKFRGNRPDLEVYHLAYGTKKLRACTYRRMLRRQKLKNQRKAELLIPKSPEEKVAKANKQQWLRQVSQIVKEQKLQAPPIVIARTVRRMKGTNKGAGKRKRKHIRKIKAKINQAKQTEMKDS